LNNPEFVKVDGKLYKINTDFRIAIECDKIARDESIGDYERALAIIYKLFGKDGLNCENQDRLIELAMKYISFNKEEKTLENNPQGKHKLDFNKCTRLISSSFKFDYNYDPYELEYLHWYDFYNDLENLSTSEFGNCCALNRIMSIINQDAKKIKDSKERKDLLDLQEELIEKYCIEEKIEQTEEQEKSAEEFYNAILGKE
jgi:hypothetical protein